MNMKDHFCLSRHLPAIALYPTQQNWKCPHIRNHQYAHVKFLESSVPWEKTSILLVLWDLMFEQILITKLKKSSSTQSEL